MPRFFFHVRRDSGYIAHPEGVVVASLGLVPRYLREVVLSYPYPVDPTWVFEVADEDGRVVLVVEMGTLRNSLH
jgi:hypothetical protein